MNSSWSVVLLAITISQKCVHAFTIIDDLQKIIESLQKEGPEDGEHQISTEIRSILEIIIRLLVGRLFGRIESKPKVAQAV